MSRIWFIAGAALAGLMFMWQVWPEDKDAAVIRTFEERETNANTCPVDMPRAERLRCIRDL